MRVARDEIRAGIEKRRRESVRRQHAEITRLAQATVPIEVITQSSEWNYFLSLLQFHVEALDAQIGGLTEALGASPDFDPVVLTESKAAIQRLVVQRDTLRSVMDLPGNILKDGNEAKLALRRYPEE